MSRRRLTIKRIDPWSVLKVGAVVNLCLWLIVLVGFGVLWFFVTQLGLIDTVCNISDQVGTTELVGVDECSISGAGIFRALFFLGLIGAVIQTALFVVAAFLYNTISQLVGGLQFITEDGAGTGAIQAAMDTAEPREGKVGALLEKVGAAAVKAKDEVKKRVEDTDGAVSEMRERAKELAAKRRSEVEEARQLDAARAAERARQLRAAQQEREAQIARSQDRVARGPSSTHPSDRGQPSTHPSDRGRPPTAPRPSDPTRRPPGI